MTSPELTSPRELGLALAKAPDPELARVAVSRLGDHPLGREALSDARVAVHAIPLIGFSTAATDFFVRHPDELWSLADEAPKDASALLAEAENDADTLGPQAGVRRFRLRASYRLAARDLAGATLEHVVGELTALAEACLHVALASVAGDAGDALPAVVGMGKLGGRELNYSSDVDVLFVHAAPGGTAQEEASRTAAALVALLSEPTVDGTALRVDTSLRPEGRAGPLSRSLDAAIQYYLRLAETWERQALLKARPVAGDPSLGRAFVDAVDPFVHPSVLPAQAVEDVRSQKARIEEIVRAQGKDGVEVKRGRGGIRDIEFAVQLLQLVHGRRHPALRTPGTLPALRALADEGFVARADADALADSYRFLRRLEHRLQMVRDLQTHELPRDRGALATLARSMGLDGQDRLLAEHARHTERVRGLHEQLFYRPLLESFAGTAASSAGLERQDTEELLTGLGFADPAAAYRAFARVVDRSTRMGRVLGGLFPVVAPALATASMPDAALVRFERVAEAVGNTLGDGFADRLAARADVARRLAALVGASSSFADALIARPALATAAFELPPAERPLFPGDPDAERLRVAAAYATRELTVPALGRRLASVADGMLSGALDRAAPAIPVAVVGLGRLGREELSFASDLDVLFVYEGEGSEAFTAAQDAAERTMTIAREWGWQVDADLRPEGRSGPAARSIASYLEYWDRWAETWEFQALLGARPVAGDEGLGRRFVANARDVAYPQVLSVEQVAAVRRMRVRMEQERVRPDARRHHFKLGYGGLADVQFAVELSLMRFGFDHPEVRRTNTLDALEALASARLIEASVGLSLAKAYVFLSEIKASMELERMLPAEALPPTPEGQAALARRLGYGERARQVFLQDYRRITHRARVAMDRAFYGESA